MPECRCATRNFSWQRGVGVGGLWNQGTSIQILSKTVEKEAIQGNTLESFLLESSILEILLKLHFGERFYPKDKHNQSLSFKIQNTFLIFKKGRGGILSPYQLRVCEALFARRPMSIRNKFETLVSLVTSDIDILMISETKIVESFPLSQFMIYGFSMLYRRDSGFQCISEIILL